MARLVPNMANMATDNKAYSTICCFGKPQIEMYRISFTGPDPESSLEVMRMEKSPSLLKSESGPISAKQGDICLYFLEVGSEGT